MYKAHECLFILSLAMQNYFMRLTKENVLILKILFKEKENEVQNQRGKPKVAVQLQDMSGRRIMSLWPPWAIQEETMSPIKEGEAQKSKKQTKEIKHVFILHYMKLKQIKSKHCAHLITF